MNRKEMFAIFATLVLLVTAASVMIVENNVTGETAPLGRDSTDTIIFDSCTKTVEGDDEYIVMEGQANASDIGMGLYPDGEILAISVMLTLNEVRKTVTMDITIDDSKNNRLLDFHDEITEKGVTKGNEWLYLDLVPKIQPQSLDSLSNLKENSEKLSDYLPKIDSKDLKDRIVKALEKSVLKKVLKSLGLAAIPVGGWALLLIKLGVSAYEINELANELQTLTRLAEIDVQGCIYDSGRPAVQLAERYGGKNNEEWIKLYGVEEIKNKLNKFKQFRVAYIDADTKTTYISDYAIEDDAAEAIMRITHKNEIESGKGLSIYTYQNTKAEEIARQASNNQSVNDNEHHHTRLHDGVDVGFKHFHNAKHKKEKPDDYPAHALYGAPMYRIA